MMVQSVATTVRELERKFKNKCLLPWCNDQTKAKVRNIKVCIIRRRSVIKSSSLSILLLYSFDWLQSIKEKNNIERCFSYELTRFSMSVFKDGLMRKPKKATLRNTLLTKKVDIDLNSLHVLNGGALLHKVRWPTSLTFGDVCRLYVDHIASKCGISTIVFDGCSDTRSTKVHELARRTINKRGCVDAQCNVSTKVNIKQDVLLSNSTNKSRFIDMLSGYLIKSGNKVINSDEDADTEIARCALYVAETGRRVNVVTEDKDVVLLVLCHWKSGMANITFTSEKSKATTDICSSLSEMPANIKLYILVLRA